MIASLNGAVQSFLPVWVRTRGLSVYQLVLFGGTAVGAAAAGVVGGIWGVVPTMAAAGVVVILVAALLLVRPLLSTADKDRSTVELPLTDVPPLMPVGPDADDATIPAPREPDPEGLTLVLVRYEVREQDRSRFVELMQDVESSRRRTGARSWALYDDRERPGFLVEAFLVGSWREHLSQHHTRTTGYDAEIVGAARDLAVGDPVVEHLVSFPRT